MTSKQLRLTAQDILNAPFFKNAVGFDQPFLDFINKPTCTTTSGYPPYNIAKITDSNENSSYEITLAVAGFTENDIEIVLENDELRVIGNSNVLEEEADTEVRYIHKGIAERSFTRAFTLHDHVEVQDATLRDGMLKIRLVQLVPEALKPKRIEIKS